MLNEFKAFALRGNVLDLAVAVIIGAAFNPIVASLVNDVIMPPVGVIVGDVDFKDRFITLSGPSYPSLAAAKEAAAPVIAYGNFLNTIVNFLIVSFSIFLLIRQINRLQKPAAAPAPTARDCPYCYSPVNIHATRCPHCTSELRPA